MAKTRSNKRPTTGVSKYKGATTGKSRRQTKPASVMSARQSSSQSKRGYRSWGSGTLNRSKKPSKSIYYHDIVNLPKDVFGNTDQLEARISGTGRRFFTKPSADRYPVQKALNAPGAFVHKVAKSSGLIPRNTRYQKTFAYRGD